MERLRRTAYILIVVGACIIFLYYASSLILPIALAGLLAMLFRGLSNKLEQGGRRRWLSALISVTVFLAGLGIVIVLLGWQLSSFTENLTEIRERLSSRIMAFRDWLQETAGINHSEQKQILEDGAKSAAATEGSGMAAFALRTLGLLLDFVLLAVYMYLLLFYRSRIKKFIVMVTPEKYRANSLTIIRDASLVAQQYLTGLMAMIGVLWVLYGIGFSIVGVEGALFFAVLCGLLEIVPFIGNLLGTTITVIAVIAQGGGAGMILGVICVYILVQGLQTYILEPLIVGKQVNINPLFTIIALVAGELLWGVAGMILAIPMLGIIKISCDHIGPLRPYGFLIGSGSKNDNN